VNRIASTIGHERVINLRAEQVAAGQPFHE
jgi:hypothetical protein